MNKTLIQTLRADSRFYHISTPALQNIAEAVMLHNLQLKQVKLKPTIPDGLWYSRKLGSRIYVIDTGEPILRPINNPNLVIDRRHVHLHSTKKLPKCFKSLLEIEE